MWDLVPLEKSPAKVDWVEVVCLDHRNVHCAGGPSLGNPQRFQ